MENRFEWSLCYYIFQSEIRSKVFSISSDGSQFSEEDWILDIITKTSETFGRKLWLLATQRLSISATEYAIFNGYSPLKVGSMKAWSFSLRDITFENLNCNIISLQACSVSWRTLYSASFTEKARCFMQLLKFIHCQRLNSIKKPFWRQRKGCKFISVTSIQIWVPLKHLSLDIQIWVALKRND